MGEGYKHPTELLVLVCLWLSFPHIWGVTTFVSKLGSLL